MQQVIVFIIRLVDISLYLTCTHAWSMLLNTILFHVIIIHVYNASIWSTLAIHAYQWFVQSNHRSWSIVDYCWCFMEIDFIMDNIDDVFLHFVRCSCLSIFTMDITRMLCTFVDNIDHWATYIAYGFISIYAIQFISEHWFFIEIVQCERTRIIASYSNKMSTSTSTVCIEIKSSSCNKRIDREYILIDHYSRENTRSTCITFTSAMINGDDIRTRLDKSLRSAQSYLKTLVEIDRLSSDNDYRSVDRINRSNSTGRTMFDHSNESYWSINDKDETCRWLFIDSTDLLENIFNDPLSIDYFNVYLSLPVVDCLTSECCSLFCFLHCYHADIWTTSSLRSSNASIRIRSTINVESTRTILFVVHRLFTSID
jgi:hypothetical protein